ncbi:hypothetical protein M8J77_003811 [Diaphorina citri]|nr:hypothetical protein M8J77_003811 [Diaphorina citri]
MTGESQIATAVTTPEDQLKKDKIPGHPTKKDKKFPGKQKMKTSDVTKTQDGGFGHPKKSLWGKYSERLEMLREFIRKL